MTDEIDRISINVNEMREPAIHLYDLKMADDAHTFYYDESNNLRRLHVIPGGLNVRDPKVYVFGGVAHTGDPRDLDVGALRSALRLQKTVKEMKLEHVAKGDFLTLLTSKKLTIFLEWVLSSDLFVHYIAMDPMFWVIIDIIDSACDGEPQLIMIAPQLKNDLYTVLRTDMAWLGDVFARFGYPNVGPSGPEFTTELLEFVEEREHLLEHFNFYMLKGVLQQGMSAKEAPFLQDETANVLIDSLLPFVTHRLCLFKESRHILDVEPFIEKRLKQFRFVDGDRELSLYRYAVSHDEPGVQISDVVVGLLAKCFSWLSRTPMDDILAILSTLDANQETNRQLIARLLARSTTSTDAYMQRLICLDDNARGAVFFDMTR